jgi:hypothetical protein
MRVSKIIPLGKKSDLLVKNPKPGYKFLGSVLRPGKVPKDKNFISSRNFEKTLR